MPTLLVIPDIHHKTEKADLILGMYEHDKVIFLGDYFDDFGDTPEISKKTAQWVKEKVNDPNNVMLVGNHDLSYRYPNNAFANCPGFTVEKARQINKILSLRDWEKMLAFHYEENYLFTHAGLHPHFLHAIKGFSLKQFAKDCEAGFESLRIGISHPLFRCGMARGGHEKVGGLVWLDWDIEFKPINGINQVCGHTPSRRVRKNITKSSNNYCIDTHLDFIAIIKDGQIKIEEVDRIL